MHFDEAVNDRFKYPEDFSEKRLQTFLTYCGIDRQYNPEDVLTSLNVVEEKESQLLFRNAGVLFFAKEPQRFFPESFITAVKYKTPSRMSIIDKKDFLGDPIEQIDAAMAFLINHMNVAADFSLRSQALGARQDISEDTALRELNTLISLNLIEKIGSGRATMYRRTTTPPSGADRSS